MPSFSKISGIVWGSLAFGAVAYAQTEARRYLFDTWPRLESPTPSTRILKDDLNYRSLLTGYRRLTERLRVFTKELEASDDANCQGPARLAAAAILEELEKKNIEIQQSCRSTDDVHPESCFRMLGLYPDLELRLLRFERSLEQCAGQEQSRKWLGEVESSGIFTALSIEGSQVSNPRLKELNGADGINRNFVRPEAHVTILAKTDSSWVRSEADVFVEPGSNTQGMQLGGLVGGEALYQLGNHALKAGLQGFQDHVWVPDPQTDTRVLTRSFAATAAWRWTFAPRAFELHSSFARGTSVPTGAAFETLTARSSYVFEESSYLRKEIHLSFSQRQLTDRSFFPKAQGVGLAYGLSGQIYSGGTAKLLAGVVERREDFKRARLYPWIDLELNFLAPISLFNLPTKAAKLGIFSVPDHGDWSATQIETGMRSAWTLGNERWDVPLILKVFQRSFNGEPNGSRQDFVGQLAFEPRVLLRRGMHLAVLANTERSYLLKRESLDPVTSNVWVARSSYVTWKLGTKLEYVF